MSKRAATDNQISRLTITSNVEGGEVPVLTSPSDGSGVSANSTLNLADLNATIAILSPSLSVSSLKAQLDGNFIEYESNMDRSALTSLLVTTIRKRSQIPRLNEDVQGYIVSFLGGFDSLRVATQLARGFRLNAKPRLDAMLKRSDADIKIAAKAWCEDAEEAREIYGPISIWNTSEVTDMADLFIANEDYGCKAAEQFNEDISRWDVSNVTTMHAMFYEASSFNGDLSSWDVSNVTTMDGMFSKASAFNGNLSSWNISNVTTMGAMFYKASAFNGDLSSWDVSNVTTMESMFWSASAFNGDLASWDVSNVTKMAGMFYEAEAFNKDTIKNWNLEGKDLGEGLFES